MDVQVSRAIEQIHYTHEVSFDLAGVGYVGMDGYAASGPIMFKSWRVIAMGFWVYGNCDTGTDPVVQFGVHKGDVYDDVSDDYWGSVTMDSAGGAWFAYGDFFLHDPLKYLKAPLICANGGTHTVVTSSHFLEWQTLGTILRVRRPLDHKLNIIPLMCIEVRR